MIFKAKKLTIKKRFTCKLERGELKVSAMVQLVTVKGTVMFKKDAYPPGQVVTVVRSLLHVAATVDGWVV